MGADNQIIIIYEKDGTFSGYNISISSSFNPETLNEEYTKSFIAISIIGAITKAQNLQAEYGYTFYNLSKEITCKNCNDTFFIHDDTAGTIFCPYCSKKIE